MTNQLDILFEQTVMMENISVLALVRLITHKECCTTSMRSTASRNVHWTNSRPARWNIKITVL